MIENADLDFTLDQKDVEALDVLTEDPRRFG